MEQSNLVDNFYPRTEDRMMLAFMMMILMMMTMIIKIKQHIKLTTIA